MINELIELNKETFYKVSGNGFIIYQKELIGDNQSIYISKEDLNKLLANN
jgi:hypothetical protein